MKIRLNKKKQKEVRSALDKIRAVGGMCRYPGASALNPLVLVHRDELRNLEVSATMIEQAIFNGLSDRERALVSKYVKRAKPIAEQHFHENQEVFAGYVRDFEESLKKKD